MVMMQKSHYQAEVSQLGKERDWLLTTYASNIIAQIDSLLKDCTRRLPTSSQRQPTSTMQTDKFTLVARNDTGKGDALRCVLTLMADNVLQAELSVRYARAPGGVFRSVAQPDVQCKLEQVMDLTNYVQRCGLAIATAFRLLRAHCGAPAGGGAARAEALMIVLLDMMENISLARDCLLAPRRRSFSELASCQLNRSFNPALPPDLLFSLYASAGKLVVAVYHLQNGGGQSGNFPKSVGEMCGLRWLKLNRTHLDKVPDELSSLRDLEHVQMARSALQNLHGELSDMPRLRSIIVRHNQIKTSGIPHDIFDMRDLTIIDFSHNSLNQSPPRLDHAQAAIILNLSHNNIESVPNQVFVNLVDLIFLDLSHNKLNALPPQIRRLTGLQVLNLSENPLGTFQLKQLPSMTSLRVLKMRNTQRTDDNLPPTMDGLVHLEEVDFSKNDLSYVPQALFELDNLRSLNLSDNKITAFKSYVPLSGDKAGSFWDKMEVLNVARNRLTALPDAITKMQKIKMILANNNKIDFDGIPAGIGKLLQLEVLHLAYNNLELIPEGIGRCVKLRKLKLNNNRLITFPEGIHLLPDLKELDVRNNLDLVMPPKPAEMKQRYQFYNIDFSLEHQMKLAGQSPTSSISSSPRFGTFLFRPQWQNLVPCFTTRFRTALKIYPKLRSNSVNCSDVQGKTKNVRLFWAHTH